MLKTHCASRSLVMATLRYITTWALTVISLILKRRAYAGWGVRAHFFETQVVEQATPSCSNVAFVEMQHITRKQHRSESSSLMICCLLQLSKNIPKMRHSIYGLAACRGFKYRGMISKKTMPSRTNRL